MLVLAVLVFVTSCLHGPWHSHLSFGQNAHVTVWTRGADSRIAFFSDADHGPYYGSVIALTDADGNVSPPLQKEESFGDSWGIYYRYFQWSDSTLWTLMVSLWYPILLFAMIPAARLLRHSFRPRENQTA